MENRLADDPDWRKRARSLHDEIQRLRRGRQSWTDWLGATRLRFGMAS